MTAFSTIVGGLVMQPVDEARLHLRTSMSGYPPNSIPLRLRGGMLGPV